MDDRSSPGAPAAPDVGSLPLSAEAVGALLSSAYLIYRFQFGAQPPGDERQVQQALQGMPGDLSGYLQAIFRHIDQVAHDARGTAADARRREAAQLADAERQLKAARQQLIELQSDANKAFDNFQRLSASIAPGNRRVVDGLHAIERQLTRRERRGTPDLRVWLPLALVLGLAMAFWSLWWLAP